MDKLSQELDLLFETSWEVCNKIGGIYAVLSTKAKTLKDALGDKLIFIGPDVWTKENPSPYFIENQTLQRRLLAKAVLPEGVTARVGRWDVPGKPVAILVKFDAMYASKERDYFRMWELFRVDSLHAYGDYDEGCAFARAAAAVIKAVTENLKANPAKVIAHFDEWTTAMGLLEVKASMPEAATVFTTHATSIGRSICGNGKPLYDYLPNYYGDQMARELNMEAKHSLEKAAAHQADSFTTVSDVTATESRQLLETPNVEVTPNGFELNFVPGKTRYKAARKAARARFLAVAKALTGVDFDDDTFILATSGRCEYRNKGIDLFLDSLASVDAAAVDRKVLAFILVPAWCGGPREDLAANLSAKKPAALGDPVLTHKLNNYHEDPINRRLHELAFANNDESNVTAIYVPCYLDGNDGIFDMTYYQLLPGLDATVFASYYEPWGYTPLESVAFGVPTITTTLAGFGKWVEEDCTPGFETSGVEVVERTDSNYAEAVGEIAADILELIDADAEFTAECRAKAMETAAKAQWTDFMSYYVTAYNNALNNSKKRNS